MCVCVCVHAWAPVCVCVYILDLFEVSHKFRLQLRNIIVMQNIKEK